MTGFARDAVLAQLTPDAVAEAYGLTGRWFGRWMRSRRCPVALHGTDAFGLSRRRMVLEGREDLLVTPEIEDLRAPSDAARVGRRCSPRPRGRRARR